MWRRNVKNSEAEPVWYGRSHQIMHEPPKPRSRLSAGLIGLGLLVAAAPLSLASCSSEKPTLDHATAYQAEREASTSKKVAPVPDQ